MPSDPSKEDIRFKSIKNAVLICLTFCTVSGVKVIVHIFSLLYIDIIWKKGIQPPAHRFRVYIGACKIITYLIKRVYTCISPSRAQQCDTFSNHNLNPVFQNLLYGQILLLPLPSMICASIIFKDKPDIPFFIHL
jgi:hypothetical protein